MALNNTIIAPAVSIPRGRPLKEIFRVATAWQAERVHEQSACSFSFVTSYQR